MKKIKLILSTLFLITIFNSCVKKEPITRIAQVLFVPLCPNAPVLDFAINNNVYANTVSYSSTIGTTSYTLPYYTIEPLKNATLAYAKNGTFNPWASVTTNFEDEKVYSTFLIDSLSKAKVAIVEDDLAPPFAEGKVKLRFFHFSPNTPSVDVYLAGTTTLLFSTRTFNDQAANINLQKFIEVDAGLFSFDVKAAGTATLLTTINSLTMKPDRIYTIAIRGFTGATGLSTSLSGWTYSNKP
jgi:hypothetical protein